MSIFNQMKSIEATSSTEHIVSFKCLVVTGTRLIMEAFKLLKKDFIMLGLIQGKQSTKWNQYVRAFVWIFSVFLTTSSYLICAIFETETLNEQSDAFFFGFGTVRLLISNIFLVYQNQSITQLLADLDSMVDDREYLFQKNSTQYTYKF